MSNLKKVRITNKSFRFLPFVTGYLKENALMAAVMLYFVSTAGLRAVTGIDICLPCIWRTLFGFSCPGCGLTTAFIYLLRLDFGAAFRSNNLIIIVLPASLYYFFKHIQLNSLPFRRVEEI